MQNIKITGYSDDCVEFMGAFSEEYYIDLLTNVWRGKVSAGDNFVYIEVDFCESNPDGWAVKLLTDIPKGWETVFSNRLDEDREEDQVLFLMIPDDLEINVEELGISS